MLFLTHLMFAAFLALLVKPLFSGGPFILFFLLVLFGSILPDIDEKNSRITKWSGLLGKITSYFAKHRGLFHSLFFIIPLTLLFKFTFGNYYAWALFIGLLSHLLADGFTKTGLNFFYPFKGLHLRGAIHTGSLAEKAFQLLLLILIIWKVF